MLTAGKIQDTNIVEARLDGEIEKNEVETLRSEINSALSEHDKLRLLFVYEGIGKMDLKAIWEDIKLETSTVSNIERMAVVTEKGWMESAIGALSSVTSMEIRTFEPGQRDEALTWLSS